MLKYVMTWVCGFALLGGMSAHGQGDWGGLFSGAVKGVTDAVKNSGLVEETKKVADSLKEGSRQESGDSACTSGTCNVPQALEEAGYLTRKKAKPEAQYYIFICSASWCPPCRRLMPDIVKTYKNEIRKDKRVDLVLLGGDSDEDGCRKYLKHYKAAFPGLHAKKKINIPNFPKIQYWPFAIFMDARGKVITTGHGNMVLNWKKHLSL